MFVSLRSNSTLSAWLGERLQATTVLLSSSTLLNKSGERGKADLGCYVSTTVRKQRVWGLVVHYIRMRTYHVRSETARGTYYLRVRFISPLALAPVDKEREYVRI